MILGFKLGSIGSYLEKKIERNSKSRGKLGRGVDSGKKIYSTTVSNFLCIFFTFSDFLGRNLAKKSPKKSTTS